ncbi:flagellar hook basal-body protein [Erythrobacter sp. LQ02-29]|uniref:flagellar hook-basal body complex protein n=1 Tax=Erythrobacter sp. LQ02-29 TaxID=2920384 RepID=UPI001F4EEDEA|nr:flagellar hook basal-body protein [Erythrobacter sp. LQ02-29]MCP9221227.1 flagellar hook basal-body protein [Erythrobacter sp. LQ02-29]
MSFYTSLNGLKNAQTDLGVIAHNIANAETTGFKKSDTQFADLVSGGPNTEPKMIRGIGATVVSMTQSFTLGPIEQTQRATDLAISGDGFFTLRGGETGKTVFTRNGAFEIDGQGFLQDGADNRVQMMAVDANGQPTNPGTTLDVFIPQQNAAGADLSGVTVQKDGRIRAAYADGTVDTIGRVALASFIAPTGLRQLGSSQWEASGTSGTASYGVPAVGRFGELQSGALERSNVDLAEEMVGLITAQRNFQANAKAIDTATQLSQTIINLRS